MAGPLALLLAVTVFAVFAETWQRRTGGDSSPVDPPPLLDWMFRLVRGDTDPDPDTDPEPICDAGDDPIGIDDCDCPRCTAWRDGPTVDGLPLAQPAKPHPTQLDVWIARSLDTGASYTDVVRQGVSMFGVGEATVKRAIRRVRDQQEAA